MVISMKGFKERRMKLKKTVNLLLCFMFLILISTFLLSGCKAQEEKTINAEIDGHYTKKVLVDGELQTEYYLIFDVENGDGFMVRVYPKTGWLMKSFEEQFPIGTVVEIKEKDKLPIPEEVIK
jgi:hypothetical protein